MITIDKIVKMGENRLRWFALIMRRVIFEAVRMIIEMNVEGRPKKRWLDVICDWTVNDYWCVCIREYDITDLIIINDS